MSHLRLKSLREQRIVITGATSGIGLVTARLAARRGARLMLAARNEQALQNIADQINRDTPGEAHYTATDVGDEDQVNRLADAARDRLGGFDTWINDAAISIYGNLMQVPVNEHRQVFETNYWGCVHGSRAAVDELAKHHDGFGGALINLGSVLGDRAIPDQGPYCASKHAIKGFTDALRMELEQRDLPISVTLIKPSAIDTPYKDHAKNYFDVKPQNPPPVYDPLTVAHAILHAAQHPRRDIYVGAAGRWVVSGLGTVLPRLSDLVMERVMSWMQKTDEPVDPGARDRHALFEPMDDGEERGVYPHYVLKSSLYTQATLHPLATAAAVGATGLLAAAAWQALAGDRRDGASLPAQPARAPSPAGREAG
ncbi:MAG: SDR family oxidoreductase [Phycisphaeraceae bacterium]